MPPKKPFSETYRGKRKARSEEMKKKKENKVFKKYLSMQGLCQDSTGYIGTYAEIGRRAWSNNEEQKEKIRDAGRIGGTKALLDASEEEKEKWRIAGRNVWEDAD